MPVILALNPGSNSLKFDIVEVHSGQHCAHDGKKLLSGTIDNIGHPTRLVLTPAYKTADTHRGVIKNFTNATEVILNALSTPPATGLPRLSDLDRVAVRVVHGGGTFTSGVRFDKDVRRLIHQREKLAPLHNAKSLDIIKVVEKKAAQLPIAVAFDTSFHHTIPEYAWRYPIDRKIADKHGIRRFGFHGLSHRYMLERYAQLNAKAVSKVSVVTLHLESGSSATAIKNGKSVDTSMGLTPLEGLMMGTRSGSIDPAIIPLLMRETRMDIDKIMYFLEKKSGLLGVSGISLDTRILRKRKDTASKLALKIFGYKVRHFVGAYLAILENAEAIVFGGGIGENTPEVRLEVCNGLAGWGLRPLTTRNARTFDGDVQISHADSHLAAWVIHVEEGMQLAKECAWV